MSIDRRKLKALLKWYRQEVGKKLIAVLVVNNDGSIFDSLTGYPMKVVDDNLIESINAIIKIILKRIEEDFRLGSFGAGTFDTAKYRFIFCKAGSEHVFITILNPLSMVDLVFPYAYLAAEKVARIFDGRTVSPVIPKIYTGRKSQNIERKIDSFQKIKVHSAQYAYKLILGGDGGVGKTSMVHRFVEDSFQAEYKSTIGTSVMKKECEFEGLKSSVRFVIFDLAGQEQFRRVRQSYLTNAEAGLLVYDVTSKSSFENLKGWYDEIKAGAPNVSLIMVGNKIDLENERVVSTIEAISLAKELGLSYIETSAKTGQNINDAFRILALQMIKGFVEAEEICKIDTYQPVLKPIKEHIPSEAEKRILRIKQQLNHIERKRLEFWEGLVDKIKEVSFHLPVLKKGLTYTYLISNDWGGVALYFYHEDSLLNQKRFIELETKKDEIQKDFASFSWNLLDELEWDFNETRNRQWILYRFKKIGLNDENQWDQLQYQMIDAMKYLVKTFLKYIENLN